MDQETLQVILNRSSIAEFAISSNKSNLVIELQQADELEAMLLFLRDESETKCSIMTDLFAIDYLGSEGKRFKLVYHLLSLRHNFRLQLELRLEDQEEAPSITKIFSSSLWYEREIYDMYGITFTNCPDPRRILTDYGFEGHPLRKDFPLSGFKQVRYNVASGAVEYEPVNLVQEYRDFDYSSPWQES